MSSVFYAVRNAMLAAGVSRLSTVVCGVSGGPDSMALLDALLQLKEEQGFSLCAAHFEHGLRGEASRADAAFVAAFCAARGIPCQMASGDVAAFAREKGCSTEAAARQMRYAFFEDCMRTRNAGFLALGHHAGDQAETMLMRLLRGGGAGALGGMAPVRRSGPGLPEEKGCALVRPLLECTRQDILDYCGQRSLAYRRDESNASDDVLRNRIRNQLMPVLQTYNPQLERALGRQASILQAESDYLERAVGALLQKAYAPQYSAWLARPLAGAHLALCRRAIYRLGQQAGAQMDFDHVERLMQALKGESGTFTLPGNVIAQVSCGYLLFAAAGHEKAVLRAPIARTGAGSVQLEGGGVMRWHYLEQLPGDWRAQAPDRIYLDAQALSGEVYIRTRRPGDRFHMLGGPGPQRLKDVLIHWKVPQLRRDALPLLVCDRGIAAVAGHMPAHWARITSGSRSYLCLEITDE